MTQVDSTALSIQLTVMSCRATCCDHENIHSHHAFVVSPRGVTLIGFIRLHILDKIAMEAVDANRMWQECNAFDEAHPGAKLNKIEKYLSNESFMEGREQLIVDAKAIVYIEAVWLEPSERGRRQGLISLQSSVAHLQPHEQSVLLLEAGAMEPSDGDPAEAGDKLARHWERLGLEIWSDSDTDWLCAELKTLKQCRHDSYALQNATCSG